MRKILFHSDRLIFKEFHQNDAPQLYLLNADPEVIKYTGDPPFESIEDAQKFVENYDHYQKYGFGRWATFLKSNNEFIGWCGIKLNEQGDHDLGFRFYKKHWGKGFATEAAKACLDHGFNKLGLNAIIGRAANENLASIRVLEKLGMEFYKEDSCGHFTGAKYYRINRNSFK